MRKKSKDALYVKIQRASSSCEKLAPAIEVEQCLTEVFLACKDSNYISNYPITNLLAEQ